MVSPSPTSSFVYLDFMMPSLNVVAEHITSALHALRGCPPITARSPAPYARRLSPSINFDVGRPNHLAPFLGFVSEQPSKVGRREREHVATENGKLGLHFGIG